MSMYGSRGYLGFRDVNEWADWKRKSDREDALLECDLPPIIEEPDADLRREDRDEQRCLEARS